jgi:type 1 glutamine amidotransferase
LLVLHTGLICFDDWPGLRDIAGGVWRWGVSSHPPRGPVHVEPTGRSHPVMDGISAFDLAEDEAYQDLDMLDDVEPLATVRAMAHGKGAWPAIWARGYKNGRVVCDTLGHSRRSLEAPPHRRLLANAARWLTE